MNPGYALLIFIVGILFGAWARRFPKEDVDLINENAKLRMENEVLWSRIKKERAIK